MMPLSRKAGEPWMAGAEVLLVVGDLLAGVALATAAGVVRTGSGAGNEAATASVGAGWAAAIGVVGAAD